MPHHEMLLACRGMSADDRNALDSHSRAGLVLCKVVTVTLYANILPCYLD